MRNISAIITLSFILFATAAMAVDKTSTFTLPSNIKVTIVEAAFEKSLFKIEGCSDRDAVCRINDHVPFGVAFGLPKTYVKSITVSFNGQSHSLDASDMYNAWGSRPLEHPGIIRYFGGKCFNKINCQFRGLFSDGAGTFAAEWAVVNGLSIRTVLTGSDDVIGLFKKYIDPPEFE